MEPAKRLHPGVTALIVIVLIGIVVTATIVINRVADKKINTSTDTTQQVTDTPTNSTGSDTVTGSYTDGTYSASGSYISPGGRESIELTVTLKDGIITSTTLVPKATNADAKDYQAEFASVYKKLVVGKSVERVSLSRVAGSSLTSNGFNQAIEQIRTDAKA